MKRCMGVIFLILCFINSSVLEAKTEKITISAAGDCTFSSDMKQSSANNFFSVYERKGPKYFFERVKSIFKKDDLSIVNFEGTLSNRGERVDKKWAFRGKPKYAKILKLGSIEAVGFANNHVKDYGEVSYTDTKKNLKQSGILYSSAENVSVKKIKGIKVAMVSVSSIEPYYNPSQRLRQLLKKARKKKPAILIVNIHSGQEYTDSATEAQRQLAHIAVDEGKANLVIGHHPHVIQGIEKRKGALIAYSLGNFVFGGNTNPADKDSMIFQATFQVKNGKVRKKAKGRVIPCSVSSVPYVNDYQPRVLKGESGQRILQRLRKMSREYGVKISKNGIIFNT